MPHHTPPQDHPHYNKTKKKILGGNKWNNNNNKKGNAWSKNLAETWAKIFETWMIWRYRKTLFLKIIISCCFKVVKIWILLCSLQLLWMRKHLNGFIKYKNTASTWWLVLKILKWLLIQIFYPEKLKHSLFNNGTFKAVYLGSVLVFSVWNCALKLLFVFVEICEFLFEQFFSGYEIFVW